MNHKMTLGTVPSLVLIFDLLFFQHAFTGVTSTFITLFLHHILQTNIGIFFTFALNITRFFVNRFTIWLFIGLEEITAASISGFGDDVARIIIGIQLLWSLAFGGNASLLLAAAHRSIDESFHIEAFGAGRIGQTRASSSTYWYVTSKISFLILNDFALLSCAVRKSDFWAWVASDDWAIAAVNIFYRECSTAAVRNRLCAIFAATFVVKEAVALFVIVRCDFQVSTLRNADILWAKLVAII